MLLKTRTVNSKTFYYRDVASDIMAIGETLGGQHPFLKYAPVQDDDVVLDLGAYIGIFAVTVAPHVRQVICYEPSVDNFDILKINVRPYSRIMYDNRVVVGDPNLSEVAYYPSVGQDQRTGSIFRTRSRRHYTVPTISIASIMEVWNPTYIRCDVEGCEYDLFGYLKLPEYVRVLAIESHFDKIIWRERSHRQLLYNLIHQGFTLTHIQENKHINTFVAVRRAQ